MILLTNGDSWTQGDSPSQTLNWKASKTEDWYDVVPMFGDPNSGNSNERNNLDRESTRIDYKFYESDIWPKVLGRNLGVETWNAGKSGSSNTSIVVRTIYATNWLRAQGKSEIFAIIGWTSMFRQLVIKESSKKDELGNYIIQRDGVRPHQLNTIPKNDRVFVETFVMDILALQNHFEVNNIKYLMFNAFDYADVEDNLVHKSINLDRWYNNSLNEGHMKEYILSKNNLKQWNDKTYFTGSHPNDVAHIQWADHLTEYIKENKLLT